jgi:hypothetical protein
MSEKMNPLSGPDSELTPADQLNNLSVDQIDERYRGIKRADNRSADESDNLPDQAPKKDEHDIAA